LKKPGSGGKLGAMIKQRSLYLAAYDVRDPRRLRRALKLCRRFSSGGQKSVHECLLTEAEKEQLLREAEEVMDFREDHFLVVPVDSRSKIYTLGIAVAPADPPFYYVD
jgi:CRISPR-associated protein Cas2